MHVCFNAYLLTDSELEETFFEWYGTIEMERFQTWRGMSVCSMQEPKECNSQQFSSISRHFEQYLLVTVMLLVVVKLKKDGKQTQE